MTILFLSDIHGIKKNLPIVKKKIEEYKCDKIVVLGDLYYIGPRNKMEEEYDIEFVKDFLESYKDRLICIRGNCDSEVDKEYSPFPIVDNLGLIEDNGLEIYLTHGHIYNETNWNKANSILVFGHYHTPFILEQENNLFINPGSISLPKDNHYPSYLLYQDGHFEIRDIEDNIIDEKDVKIQVITS